MEQGNGRGVEQLAKSQKQKMGKQPGGGICRRPPAQAVPAPKGGSTNGVEVKTKWGGG